MKTLLFCFLFCLAGLSRVQAGIDEKWKEVRDHQPPGLQLKVTLSKHIFFQGERIDAKLDFSNDDPSVLSH
jgi:hypothetical protein